MLALLLAALSPFAAAPVAAQTTTQVSTIGQTHQDYLGTSTSVQSQAFTTGSHASGYTLSSIEAVIRETANASLRAAIRAELWSAATGGGPGSRLAVLTVPATVSAGTNSFAAPASTTLSANTTYYFVYYTVGTDTSSISYTRSDNEDSGKAAGWSIGNTLWYYVGDTPETPGSSWTEDTASGTLRIAVKGAAKQTTTTTPVRNLLTGLTISDGTNNLPLQPNLANAAGLRGPGIYAVHVNPGIRSITVTPTFTEATVDARTYGASSGAGGTSQLGHKTWGSSESGTAKSLPLLSYDGVTRLEIQIGSALYQIYVYHNYYWESVNARLKALEMRRN